MTSAPRPRTARQIIAEAGPTISIPEVGICLGVNKNTAYRLARQGELSVRVLRFGSRLRVPTADLRRLLGMDGGEAA